MMEILICRNFANGVANSPSYWLLGRAASCSGACLDLIDCLLNGNFQIARLLRQQIEDLLRTMARTKLHTRLRKKENCLIKIDDFLSDSVRYIP